MNMDDEIGTGELQAVVETPAEADAAVEPEDEPEGVSEPVPPIENRFLYVDVAAQRAKQLRRGALPRLEELEADAETDPPENAQRKFERIAMQEVDRGKIRYEVPDAKPPSRE